MIALVATKFFLIFLFLSFLLVLSVELLGRLLTANHLASCSNSYFIPSSQLFDFIQDVNEYPNWRNGIKEIRTEKKGSQWREIFGRKQSLEIHGRTSQNGSFIFNVSTTGSSPFSLNRTYTIYRRDKLSFLRIEDQLGFSNAALRIYCAFFYDHSKTIQKELKNLDTILS